MKLDMQSRPCVEHPRDLQGLCLQTSTKVTGPLEAGLKETMGQKNTYTKAKLKAAMSGPEERYLADQAEMGIAHTIKQVQSSAELERVLKQLLEMDNCSVPALRHRLRSSTATFDLICCTCRMRIEVNGTSCWTLGCYIDGRSETFEWNHSQETLFVYLQHFSEFDS